MNSKSHTALQFSLRELLILIFAVGLGLASLNFAGFIGIVFYFFAWLLCCAMFVSGFCDRGHRQAYGIGFVCCLSVYFTVLWFAGEKEFDPYEGKLPSSQLLQNAYAKLSPMQYVNTSTNEVVEGYHPPRPSGGGGFGGGGMGGSGPGGGGFIIQPRERLNRTNFMATGHVLWALLFGYFGARYAVYVHARDRKVLEMPV